MKMSVNQESGLPLPQYEACLLNLRSEAVKKMARAWVGKDAYKLNKERCAKAIADAIADPNTVRRVLGGVPKFERAGLGFVKRHGPTVPTEELAMELLMSGIPFDEHKPNRSYHDTDSSLYKGLDRLLELGLVLWCDRGRYNYGADLFYNQYHDRPEVFSDKRLLAEVEIVPPTPLVLSPVSAAERVLVRQPSQVLLRFIAFTETLRKVGRIDLTTQGRLSKYSLTKLVKALGWDDALAADSSTPMANATDFFVALFRSAGLIKLDPSSQSLVIDSSVERILTSPYDEQAGLWMSAYRSLKSWIEYKPPAVWWDASDLSRGKKFAALRAALEVALAALPQPSGWYRIVDISDGIFSRVGLSFSLSHVDSFYAPFKATPAQIEKKRQEWRRQVHLKWSQNEQRWIEQAIVGPLFSLGLLELAFEKDQKTNSPSLVRLSEIGLEVIYRAFRPKNQGATSAVRRIPSTAATQEGPCWVVQPNFEVLVYLDHASAARLCFMERVATRSPSQGATALYRLTRESVYQAMESGLDHQTLIANLATGSEYPLPDNVRQTLADWIARRERMIVYRAADILEFANAAARDRAISVAGLQGLSIGDRFLMIPDLKRLLAAGGVGSIIDYRKPCVRCLNVAEDGRVTIDPARADLLVRAQVASWAEPDASDGNRWRMTRSSIQKAMARGWTAERIIERLSPRALDAPPKIFLAALRAWTGAHTTVALASDLILQVADKEIAEAIIASEILQPYFRGRLGPNTFLVRNEASEALRRQLEEFGLELGVDLAFGLY
ncbi:MAG: helicase-associated domain-containing protein [Acidobacteria bacterium]|nr:helicase-associated domain-containing protein [Acidobacteriota bacterium]MBI3656869.1 helicase-associated domain-containing protein [Acidobacteriota bacterium]